MCLTGSVMLYPIISRRTRCADWTAYGRRRPCRTFPRLARIWNALELESAKPITDHRGPAQSNALQAASSLLGPRVQWPNDRASRQRDEIAPSHCRPLRLKADIVAAQTYTGKGPTHVRFGSLADICSAKGHVRFTPESDIKCDIWNAR
jgi:hypothetical protein